MDASIVCLRIVGKFLSLRKFKKNLRLSLSGDFLRVTK